MADLENFDYTWEFYGRIYMKAMRQILIGICMMSGVLLGDEAPMQLVPKEIEWRHVVSETYATGAAKKIQFFSEGDDGEEILVKRVFLSENGSISKEEDLIKVDTSSPGFKKWGDSIVPHGLSVQLNAQGRPEKVTCYSKGIEHGPSRTYYPNGQLQFVEIFEHGVLEGPQVFYYENGNKEKESRYVNGKLEGNVEHFFSNGKKKEESPYKDGQLDGICTLWHENGSVKAKVFFKEGKRTDDGSTPAEVVYDEYGAIQWIVHFQDDRMNGLHQTYYSNGQEKVRAPYLDGDLHGTVKTFSEDGVLIGERSFEHGQAVGKHWLKFESGSIRM